MEEIVILGGGLAGLACLNALLDRGIDAQLIEKGVIGSPKLCGEFLAPDAVHLLEKWEIGPITKLDEITFTARGKTLSIRRAAGAMARSKLELKLAERARKLGGRIVEKGSSENIKCQTLFLATGKRKADSYPYVGFKAHVTHESFLPKLCMHSIPGGYYGVVPISESVSNITCLVRKEQQNTFLALHAGIAWQEGKAPEFGQNIDSYPPHVYPIGDALGSLPPATGGGASHSLHSALAAVEHYLEHDVDGFRAKMRAEFYKRYRMASLLHFALARPWLAKSALQVASPIVLRPLLRRIGFNDDD